MNRESNQLPPGNAHRWIVVLRGQVEPPVIDAASAYLAREKARVLHACENKDLSVGLLPAGMSIVRRKVKAP